MKHGVITSWNFRSALVIVAHPDDEIIWAGGTILMHPETRWTVVALCRRSDPDRAPRFRQVLKLLKASGEIGDLNDGPDQAPLQTSEVQTAVRSLVHTSDADLILTHSLSGEYTRHLRHEETARAVLALWDANIIRGHEMWTFAYRDTGAASKIIAEDDADVSTELSTVIWDRKRALITDAYGFAPDSFEARAALQREAFWRVRSNTPFDSICSASMKR